MLTRVPLFAGLPVRLREHMAATMTEETHPAGAMIVAAGDPGDCMYVIASGRAEVSIKGRDRPVQVGILGAGDAFGELALVLEGVCSAAVTALVTTTLLRIDRGVFNELLAADPALAATAAAHCERLLVTDFLRQATPFTTLAAGQLQNLAARIARRRVEAGEVIVRQGEKGHEAFLLRSGRAEVLLRDAEGERTIGTLWPGTLFGEAALLSEQPRNAAVRAVETCELLVLDRQSLIWAIEQDAGVGRAMVWLMTSRGRPRQAPNIEAHHLQAADGTPLVVLKDPRRYAYYRLSPETWFLWQRMDGRHTMRMLTLEFMGAFKSFSPGTIAATVAGLAHAGFIEMPAMRVRFADTSNGGPLARAMSMAARALDWQVALGHADTWIGVAYRAGPRLLFTRPGAVIAGAVAAVGAVALLAQAQPAAETTRALTVATEVRFLVPAMLLAVVLHECGHAFAVKACGREVPRVGLGWHWISPVAFVDTSDMWLGTPSQRVMVGLAGPFANAFTGGVAMAATYVVADPVVDALLWQFALFSYWGALVNLDTLLDYDGYHVLADLFDRPNLRAQALAYVAALLTGNASLRATWRAHIYELAYWAASLGGTAAALAVTVVIYRLLLQERVAVMLSPWWAGAIPWMVLLVVALAGVAAARSGSEHSRRIA